MTDTTRDLLISLASHMAYMQGQLEARHELDDPEDYYWYRESVLLRQKVTDELLADESAVPEGREPAAVITEPSDEEGPSIEDVEELCEEHCFNVIGYESIERLQGLINEAIARWGNLKGLLTSSPPADGEVTPDSCNRGLLPMIISATGDPDEPELERIICSSISGGADYLNGMPRELSLQRITAEGSVFARYIQGPRSPELTLNSTEQPAPPAELSPEAQAVSDAVKKISPASADEIAAAALRAAAKRVGPSEILPPGYAYSAPAEELYYQFRLREMNQLLGVAAELDLCQPGPGRAGAGGEQ